MCCVYITLHVVIKIYVLLSLCMFIAHNVFDPRRPCVHAVRTCVSESERICAVFVVACAGNGGENVVDC